MQRPRCRISKVIDVIRLLTSASSHAQNIKEAVLDKWMEFCCVGLAIHLWGAHMFPSYIVQYVSKIAM